MCSTHVSDLVGDVVQIRMLHSLSGCNAICWVALEHLFEEVEPLLVEVWHESVERAARVVSHIGHVLLIKRQFRNIWPFIHCWSASDLEDFSKLVTIVLPGEEWLTIHDLCKDTSNGPNIN